MGVISHDDASDSIYSVWTNGQNGGFGWGAWVIPASGFTGGVYAVTDSTLNGSPAIGPGINTAGRAWQLTGGASLAIAAVERPFPRAVTTGDYFCIQIDSPAGTGTTTQFELTQGLHNLGQIAVTVTFPSSGSISISDGTGTINTSFNVDSGGFDLQFYWASSTTYKLFIRRKSDGATFDTFIATPGYRSHASSFSVDHFFASDPTEVSPTFSLYLNNATFADSSGGYSGCAGDPHFVGFDGERFDFHNHGWHLLWEGEGLTVEAKFDLDKNAQQHSGWVGTTFITDLKVKTEKETKTMNVYENLYLSADAIETESGLQRGIIKSLAFVAGNLLGGEVIKFKAGFLVIGVFDSGFKTRNFNTTFVLNNHAIRATGIIGQTIMPKYLRVPNELFLIEDCF